MYSSLPSIKAKNMDQVNPKVANYFCNQYNIKIKKYTNVIIVVMQIVCCSFNNLEEDIKYG